MKKLSKTLSCVPFFDFCHVKLEEFDGPVSREGERDVFPSSSRVRGGRSLDTEDHSPISMSQVRVWYEICTGPCDFETLTLT